MDPIFLIRHTALEQCLFFHDEKDAKEALDILTKDSNEYWSMEPVYPGLFFNPEDAEIQTSFYQLSQSFIGFSKFRTAWIEKKIMEEGILVRKVKHEKRPKEEVDAAVQKLLAMKAQLAKCMDFPEP